MTPRAPKTNAPLRRGEKQKIEAIEKLKAKYVAEGLSDNDADEQARRELRDE